MRGDEAVRALHVVEVALQQSGKAGELLGGGGIRERVEAVAADTEVVLDVGGLTADESGTHFDTLLAAVDGDRGVFLEGVVDVDDRDEVTAAERG